MRKLIEYPLQGGGTVLVQVEDASTGPVTRGLRERAKDMAQRSSQTFEEATQSVTPAAETLISRLKRVEHPPDEIGLEFGIQLAAEAGAFIASAAAEANFKVSLTWRRDSPND
jgi:hypothetical protein